LKDDHRELCLKQLMGVGQRSWDSPLAVRR